MDYNLGLDPGLRKGHGDMGNIVEQDSINQKLVQSTNVFKSNPTRVIS